MLDALSEKLERVLKRLRGQGVLTEQNVAEALKEVRVALLEADVNFKIVKEFLERIREKAIGADVLQSLTPGHHVVKVVLHYSSTSTMVRMKRLPFLVRTSGRWCSISTIDCVNDGTILTSFVVVATPIAIFTPTSR